jgi:drug/metabolite transporter (DMT)-like permease
MDIRSVLMGLAFVAMWSSAFTSARIIVTYAPPLSALSLRFLISGLIGVGIAFALGQTARLTARQWRAVVIFGVCQNALYLGLNFVAMQTIEASLASVIASSLPLMVALAGWTLFRERLPALAIAGLLAGFAGVALIMGSRITQGVDLRGMVLCLIGAASLTVATLSVGGATSRGNVLMVVGLQMLVGSVALAIPAALTETLEVTWTWQLVAAFAYTTIVPGLLATLVWFLLVGRIGAVRAATYHFLNPFLGVGIAAVILGEALHPLDLIGVAIVAGGILAVQLAKQSPSKA